jgi:ATP-dependent DNA helicase RecQ
MTDGNTATARPSEDAAVTDALRRYWGFTGLRPLQDVAIRAGLARRDSLVVLPTGGGKSLCYQLPPLVAGRTDVVVSPLISLMKDQVDALATIGYPAAALHGNLEPEERRRIEAAFSRGALRLLFVAPERLVGGGFFELARRAGTQAFAIDEAHCISQWGHDFRPEYRQLASLRREFPEASLHAFTATATPRVREDIVAQLALRSPEIVVGTFDRPNLVYRVLPQLDLRAQVLEAVQRHAGEAVIVYCLARKDTESMAAFLAGRGICAAAYHAGLDAAARARVQDDFAAERLQVVVATVAFGMGIDRSNVRCVVHATMPKSLEHYQQETGRAGRDGLEAECVLFYSAGDVFRWRSLIGRSAAEAGAGAELVAAQEALLWRMQGYCTSARCRHAALSEYFGQPYEREDCGACDVCLHEVEGLEDATVVAQKILSCVARTGQRFGVGHVVDVLTGADSERVRSLGHDALSTYGLLKGTPKAEVTSLVYQLVDAGVLERTDGDRPVLVLNDRSWQVMRGTLEVRLLRASPKGSARAPRADAEGWEGVDPALFARLRQLRRTLAAERGVPAYVVLDDRALRALARHRPTTMAELRTIRGIGEKRAADWGERLLEALRQP